MNSVNLLPDEGTTGISDENVKKFLDISPMIVSETISRPSRAHLAGEVIFCSWSTT
jgi:hypothetical protein